MTFTLYAFYHLVQSDTVIFEYHIKLSLFWTHTRQIETRLTDIKFRHKQ